MVVQWKPQRVSASVIDNAAIFTAQPIFSRSSKSIYANPLLISAYVINSNVISTVLSTFSRSKLKGTRPTASTALPNRKLLIKDGGRSNGSTISLVIDNMISMRFQQLHPRCVKHSYYFCSNTTLPKKNW